MNIEVGKLYMDHKCTLYVILSNYFNCKTNKVGSFPYLAMNLDKKCLELFNKDGKFFDDDDDDDDDDYNEYDLIREVTYYDYKLYEKYGDIIFVEDSILEYYRAFDDFLREMKSKYCTCGRYNVNCDICSFKESDHNAYEILMMVLQNRINPLIENIERLKEINKLRFEEEDKTNVE